MAVSYQELPLYTLSDSLNEKTKEQHYKHLATIFRPDEVSLLLPFHTGKFQLTGTTHVMPEFLISDELKEILNYPQGFLIMEAASGYYTDRSGLNSYELRYTLDGEGVLWYRDKKYILRKGEGFFIDCREPHLYRTYSDSWTSTIFHINGTMTGHLFRQYAADGNVTLSTDDCPDFEMLQFQVLRNTQKILPHKDYKISCLIDILLTELLISRARGFSPDTEHEMVPQIISYLQDYYRNDITLEFLTHRFGIGRNRLCRDFRNYTGFSVKKYLLTLRISQAKLLLQGTGDSVELIAEQVGFHDTAHFIQMFKQEVGMTPLRFRKGT